MFRVSCFRHLMTSWHLNIWNLKFDYLKNEKSFRIEIKNIFFVSQVLSVRHINQTSKNVAESTFNDKIMNSDCTFSLLILNKLTCVILSLWIIKNFVQIFLTALGNVSKTYWFLLNPHFFKWKYFKSTFRTQSNIWNGVLFFCKKLHLSCLRGFRIHLFYFMTVLWLISYVIYIINLRSIFLSYRNQCNWFAVQIKWLASIWRKW